MSLTSLENLTVKHTIKTAEDLTMYLLDEALVALVTGEAFGDGKCVRISYAASEDVLKNALTRMKTALDKLV
jgi:aspartate aminotransferase